MHGSFAVNDLVVEMSHLLDRDTARKVELKMLEGRLKHEFDLGHNFSLVDRRNKEIDLVHQELEEVQWRKASALNESEKASIKEMISLGRGVDKFDQAFLDTDMKSFDAFFDEANTFENRMTLLENWICRKEQEYRSRVNLPTKDL